MTRKTFDLFGMDESRGVSPVIGVILMVAITVILAAVIGTFVLGLGENVSTSTPQAQLTLSADASTDNISVEHKGGDPIPAGDITVKVTDESDGTTVTLDPGTSQEELTVGDTGIITTNATDAGVYWTANTSANNVDGNGINLADNSPYTVQIIHDPSDQLIMDRTVRP